MKKRIIKVGEEFYPQYLAPKTFWRSEKWKYYEEESDPCFLSGAGGGMYQVSFGSEESAKDYLDRKERSVKRSVVWTSDDKPDKRPIKPVDVEICDVCFIDKTDEVYNIGDDYFRECKRCGHKVSM